MAAPIPTPTPYVTPDTGQPIAPAGVSPDLAQPVGLGFPIPPMAGDQGPGTPLPVGGLPLPAGVPLQPAGLPEYVAETQADGSVLLRIKNPDGSPGPAVKIIPPLKQGGGR